MCKLSLVAESRAILHCGSRVSYFKAQEGPSCPSTRGIVSDQESNPCLASGFLTTGSPGKPWVLFFSFNSLFRIFLCGKNEVGIYHYFPTAPGG